jgi:hypothetical protein
MPPDYPNDVELPDDAVLWRAINPHHVKDDLSVSSAAYSTDGLSVYAIDETSPAALAAKFEGWSFQFFTAKAARDAGCIICKVPDDIDGDTSHREIRRASNPAARLRKEAKLIGEAAKWVHHDDVPPPQPRPPLPPI